MSKRKKCRTHSRLGKVDFIHFCKKYLHKHSHLKLCLMPSHLHKQNANMLYGCALCIDVLTKNKLEKNLLMNNP